MTTKTALFSTAWAITCGSAFMIGRVSTTPSTEASSNSPESSATSSSRNVSSNSSSSSSPKRVKTSRSGSAPSANSIAAVRSRVTDLKNMSDPIARAEGFLALVRELGPGEFQDAIAAFREGGIDESQFGEYRLLLTAWAQVNPLEALDYAKENTGSPFARQTILASWAQTDTEGAVAWARENFVDDSEGANRANPWLVGVIEGIAGTDLARATQLLEELPFSRGRGEALEAIFDEVANTGSDNAKRWIAQLTDPRLQEGAAARLAAQLAESDPQGAADWAASLSPEILTRSTASIIDQWAEDDLTAAKSWVAGQPSNVVAASGPNLIENIIKQEDIATAEAWLSNYEGQPEFDSSVRSLVYRSMEQEPATAANWIMKLSNTRDQERTFHRVLGGWIQQDREGAIDYINNNPVPESIKRRAGITQEGN